MLFFLGGGLEGYLGSRKGFEDAGGDGKEHRQRNSRVKSNGETYCRLYLDLGGRKGRRCRCRCLRRFDRWRRGVCPL